ncbi:MAG: oligosaccharide flippase family protein [Bryobacteraceae bacterium]
MVAIGPAAIIRAAEPRRLAVNFLFLSAGEFTAKLLTFASFTYLGRTLGPASYGAIEFTLAVMVFFTLPTDMGLGAYGAREIARNPAGASRLLREITGLRLLLSLCSMLLLVVFIFLLHKSPQQKTLLALYGLSLLGTPYLLQWFFQAHDQMYWVGAASIVRQGAFALLVFAVCRAGFPLIYIGLIECAAVVSTAVFCVYVVKGRMRYPWPRPDLGIARLMGHIREASPIGLSELAWGFMWYFCTVLLGFLSPDRSLGWFGASHRTVMAMHTFVWLYFFNLLPSISRCAVLPRAHLVELMDRSLRFTAWTGLCVAPILTAAAPQVLTLIYGPSFRDGSHSFAVLVWVLPVAMLSGHHRYILIAYNHQNWLLRCTSIAAAVAVILAFALVPWYKDLGAAWALLIANVVSFALAYFAVRKFVSDVPVHRQVAAPLAALVLAVLCFLGLAKWNVLIAGSVAAAVYVGGFMRSDGARLIPFLRAVVRGEAASDAAKLP